MLIMRLAEMHRKIKLLIAGWLAARTGKRARHLRRALRDYERAELRRIHAADRRARGLRLYVAWSGQEKLPMSYRMIVALKSASGAEERAGRRAA